MVSRGCSKQEQLSCQSKSEGELLLVSTRQHLFGKAGSTFVSVQAPSQRERIKVLRRSVVSHQHSALSQETQPQRTQSTQRKFEIWGYLALRHLRSLRQIGLDEC
jgi:hypothetical protein